MTRPAGSWPPVPPEPPHPPFPPGPPEYPRTPWQPVPRPSAPGPSTSMSVVVGAGDWLAERLLEQRVLALAGEIDADTVSRTVAELALLDSSGDEPVRLRLSGVSVDVEGALTLVDALDLVGAPVHATCLGALRGAAVVVPAVCDRRVAGAHAVFQLTEPRAPRRGLTGGVETLAAEHSRQLRRLQERLAEATGRDVEKIAADMRAGRLLSVEEAQGYGLLDAPS
jgi:ATP-dependent Clp protease protease subunit